MPPSHDGTGSMRAHARCERSLEPSPCSCCHRHYFALIGVICFPIAPLPRTRRHETQGMFSSPAPTSESREAWIVVPRDHSISLSSALRNPLMSFKQNSINSSSLHSRTITPARRIGETIQSEKWQPLCVYMETNKITNKEGMWRQTLKIQYLCQFPDCVESTYRKNICRIRSLKQLLA